MLCMVYSSFLCAPGFSYPLCLVASYSAYFLHIRSLGDNPQQAHAIANIQIEAAYTNAMTSLLMLIQFTDGLVPAIHDATMVEENQLLLIIVLSVGSLLIGMMRL